MIPQVVHGFDTDAIGYHLRASLVRGPDGKLFGTAWSGSKAHPSGGSVFALNPANREVTLLHGFTPMIGGRNDDGYGSVAPLTLGADHRLYGTAREGGQSGVPNQPGVGTLFSLLPDGSDFAVHHHFGTQLRFADGANPSGAPTFDGRGNFYGATSNGGSPGSGVIYKWDGSTLTALHTFDAFDRSKTPARNHDGGGPYGSPVFGPDGLLYGMTTWGGINGRGTVYALDPNSGAFTVLYNFAPFVFSGNQDNPPLQSLFCDSAGALWLTNEFGGKNGTGLIARLVERTVTIVHEFGIYSAAACPRFSNSDGALPLGTPIEAPDGYIYGTTYYGGAKGTGCIWRIGKDGREFELVHSFISTEHNPESPGAYPATGLVVGIDGALYGTTFHGGAIGGGAVYRLTFDPCQAEADGLRTAEAFVANLQSRLESLQNQLRNASPTDKPRILEKIRQLEEVDIPIGDARIERAQRALESCRLINP
jgi:uncharacterized repeat protein (TIGR03803 family)